MTYSQVMEQEIAKNNYILGRIILSEHFIRCLLDLFFGLSKSSAAVAYPLRGLKHYVFRDALLHTTVVMCGYLLDCHLPVSFNQSGLSPLISLVNNMLGVQLFVYTTPIILAAKHWSCFSQKHGLMTLKIKWETPLIQYLE